MTSPLTSGLGRWHVNMVQSCLTLCDPSPLGSSVHGILQARILEWVAISSSKGSSPPRDRTCISCVSCLWRQILYHCATWEALTSEPQTFILTGTLEMMEWNQPWQQTGRVGPFVPGLQSCGGRVAQRICPGGGLQSSGSWESRPGQTAWTGTP